MILSPQLEKNNHALGGPATASATIADWLALFIGPDDVAELRALHVTHRYGKPSTVAGFYDGRHLVDMATEALRLTDLARGVYLTLNPLKGEILARCANRTKIAESGDLASDQHIDRRRWLLIDVDPVRIAGISATDAEKAASLDVANAVSRHLSELGWPAPIVADSGNGFHLLYRLDLPTDDGGLVQRCLAALAARFDTDKAKVDKSVFNPARIVKLPGTLARKGDPTPDRPHRRSEIVTIPATILPTPLELMAALAAEVTPKASVTVPAKLPASATNATPPAERNGKAGRNHRLDVARWLSDRGVAFRVKDAKDTRGRNVYALDACPFNSDHKDAAVLQADDGKLGFHCFHDSCTRRGWQHCKEVIGKPDGDHYDPPIRAKDDDEKEEGGSHAVLLMELALSAVHLFHDGDTAYASAADTPVTFPLESQAFRKQLRHLFFTAKRRVPSGEALKAALDTLAGKALFAGPNLPVHVRLAEHDGAIFLDLGREDWAAVKITPSGWDVVTRYPVHFRHPRGMMGLPLPTRGGSLADLRTFLNVASDADWRLLVAWVLAALRPSGPYPTLILAGEQGAAKSTAGKLLRSLIDPNVILLRTEPRDVRDVAIAAGNSWVYALDNLSYLPNWLSDSLCRLSTGGGFATRELYADREEALFDFQRPAILTSIDDVVTRGDLLDRGVIVRLPAIPKRRRRLESEIMAGFAAARPAILGAILDAVAAGLRNLPDTHLVELPRMADFAQWVSACEPALGWPVGAFLDAYTGSVEDANELPLEASAVWPWLRKMLPDGTAWEGTSTELLDKLAELAGDKVTKEKHWPKKPHALSGQLKRLAPNMRRAGLDVVFDRTGPARTIRLTATAGKTASRASQASFTPENREIYPPADDAPVTLSDAPQPVENNGNHAAVTLGDAYDAISQTFAAHDSELI